MLLEILLIFGLSVCNYAYAHLETPDLCVVSSPLVTPYFTPWLETPRKAHGCWASPRGANMVEVHVLVLRGRPVSSWVNLDVLGHGLRNSLVLVLMSTHTVNWKVTTQLANGATQPHVMVSNGSTLESYAELNTSQHEWRNRRALQRYLQQKFKTVSSYTEVHGANRLELTVGLQWTQDHCNVHSRSESRVVTASQAVQIKTEGCFHKSYIGDNPLDVYIVELDAGESHNGRGERADRSSMPVVLVRLHEGLDSAEELLTELHNLTLVLKSSVPVRWRFGHTPRNTGKIVVVSNEGDQVENEDHPGLSVRLVHLPDKLDDLLVFVATEFGPPVMYAKTGRASTLNLIVGSCSSKVCLGGLMKVIPVSKIDYNVHADGRRATEDALSVMQQQPVSSDQNKHNLKADEVRARILAQLKEVMIINCSEKRFTVSFPLFLVQQLGSPLISFSDRSCMAVANRTHMTLTSPLTSCGSTSKIDGRLTAFYNYVHVSLIGLLESNGDVYNEEYFGDLGESEGIPVVCKNQPYYIGGKVDVEDSSEFDTVEHDAIKHKSLYNLELYRDNGFLQQLNFHTINFRNEVRIGERLYVRASMEGGGTKVQLVTENCWLTNSSDPKSKIRMFLLRNACPADQCVSLLEQHGSFSFQTGHKFDEIGAVYLHCRIGMCTRFEPLTKGNLALCVDTKQHCLKPNPLIFVNQTTVSTAQQIVTRGPIMLVPHFKTPVNSIEAIPAPTSAEAIFPQVVDMNTNCVSIPTTVAIALTSFVIGIVLMIIIWFIHIKTDPLRHRTKQMQQAGGMTSTSIGAGGTVFSGLPSSACSTANL